MLLAAQSSRESWSPKCDAVPLVVSALTQPRAEKMLPLIRFSPDTQRTQFFAHLLLSRGLPTCSALENFAGPPFVCTEPVVVPDVEGSLGVTVHALCAFFF